MRGTNSVIAEPAEGCIPTPATPGPLAGANQAVRDPGHLTGRPCKTPAPSIGDCVDFANPSPCDDADHDGWHNQIEWNAGSDWQDAQSTPEHRLVDLQLGHITCSDKIDNDGDGRRDHADTACR